MGGVITMDAHEEPVEGTSRAGCRRQAGSEAYTKKNTTWVQEAHYVEFRCAADFSDVVDRRVAARCSDRKIRQNWSTALNLARSILPVNGRLSRLGAMQALIGSHRVDL